MDNNPNSDFGNKIPEKKTAQENIREPFLAPTDKVNKEARQNAAALGLGDAEKSAINLEGADGEKTGLAGAKNAEDKTGLYTGGGKAALANSVAKGVAKGKISTKKKGASLAAIFIVLIAGAIASLTQLFQPFDFLAQLEDTFDSMPVSTNKRADVFFKKQLSNERTKNPVVGSKLFGQKFKISKKQQTKLKEKGIEYDDETFKNSKGKAIKVLKYVNSSGKTVVVGADDKAVEELNKIAFETKNTDTVTYETEAVSFKDAFTNDEKFKTAYQAGSMTWRGAFANWFGKNTKNFLTKNKITRNLWEKWQEKKKEAGGDEDSSVAKKLFKEMMSDRSSGVDGGGNRILTKEKDEDGNEITTKNDLVDSSSKKSWNKDTVKTKLETIEGKFNGSNLANVGCVVFDMVGAINLLVYANEIQQILTLTAAYLEGITKVEVGKGDESPITELAESLNEKVENIHTIISDDGKSSEDVPSRKTAMEAAGVAALYNYEGKVDPQDPSVSSFNLMSNTKKLLGGVLSDTNDVSSYKNCLIAKTAESAVNIGADAFSCMLTAGIGCVAKDIVIGIGTSVVLGKALSLLVEFAIPKVTNMLTRDLISDLGGEDLGNALTYGANVYQGGVHRANGGSLSTIDKYESYAVARKEVALENAEYERSTLSPFDITSSNTFLGSVMRQMSNFSSVNSLTDIITTGGSTVLSSIIAMLPSSMAMNLADSLPDSMEEYSDVAPYLASINAIGGSFGDGDNYTITDVSTIEDDPADVINVIHDNPGKGSTVKNLSDNETSDGNVIINENSNLAKWIKYCGERSSQFGVADQNISNELGGDFASTGVGSVDSAIGSVPFVGDLIDMISNQQQLDNIGWITGESCVAGNNVAAANSPNWDEAKYYQRFVEDQSLAESMGLIEQSAVSAYLDKYYEENPIDNSYEGLLARYSGMTKDNVVALLDVVEYYDFIANYDASDRYAFGGSVVEEDDVVEFDNENVLAGEYILTNRIIYADVRNRVFTV